LNAWDREDEEKGNRRIAKDSWKRTESSRARPHKFPVQEPVHEKNKDYDLEGKRESG